MVDIPVDVGKEPPLLGVITKTQIYMMVPGILLALLLLFAIPIHGSMKIYLVAAVVFIWVIGSLYKVDETPLLLHLADILKFNMTQKKYTQNQIYTSLLNIKNIDGNRILTGGGKYVSVLSFTFPSVALKTPDETENFSALQTEMLNSTSSPIYFKRTPILYDPYTYTESFKEKINGLSGDNLRYQSVLNFCTAYENEMTGTPRRIPQIHVLIPVNIPSTATKNELKKIRSNKTTKEEKEKIKQNIRDRDEEKINDILVEREDMVINAITSMDPQIQTIIPDKKQIIGIIKKALTPEAL